jgi:hypothetical protein
MLKTQFERSLQIIVKCNLKILNDSFTALNVVYLPTNEFFFS